MTEEKYWDLFRMVYKQTDDYIGKFMHLAKEGWDIMLASDHGQVCLEYEYVVLGDPTGCTIPVIRELGFITMVKDADGKNTYEIDWDKTTAIANQGNNIYINLKGRTVHGIVDPENQYEREEEIMTALYNYKSPHTGRRVVAVALRNKDAILLDYGGPRCGDICFWLAEGYNLDHGDSLSTTNGIGGTSVSPIFAAIGPSFKKNFRPDHSSGGCDTYSSNIRGQNAWTMWKCTGLSNFSLIRVINMERRPILASEPEWLANL